MTTVINLCVSKKAGTSSLAEEILPSQRLVLSVS
jgi:hypothetical protein